MVRSTKDPASWPSGHAINDVPEGRRAEEEEKCYNRNIRARHRGRMLQFIRGLISVRLKERGPVTGVVMNRGRSSFLPLSRSWLSCSSRSTWDGT